MPSAIRRRSPEELLQQLQAEEDYERRGRLKVFLGYASGVGKSFRMLDEGRRRKERGQDVVVGAIQPKTPPEIEARPEQAGSDSAARSGRGLRDGHARHSEAPSQRLPGGRIGLRQPARIRRTPAAGRT